MPQEKKPSESFEPRGTMAVSVIFLVTLIVLWGSVYYILISRGVTL